MSKKKEKWKFKFVENILNNLLKTNLPCQEYTDIAETDLSGSVGNMSKQAHHWIFYVLVQLTNSERCT